VFCPLCYAEFDRVIADCPNCGAKLVASEEDAGRNVPRVVLWQGDHPDLLALLLQRLAEAKISFFAPGLGQGIRYKWPMNGPRFRVYVLESDFERAKKIADGVKSEFVENDARAIGLTAAVNLESARTPRASGDWDRLDQGVEVWSGNDSRVADFLRESLRTNEIAFRTRGESSSQQKLEVHPNDAARAREIVREILEGTPPQ